MENSNTKPKKFKPINIKMLRAGEKIKCPKCGKGYIVSKDAIIATANTFECNNPECNLKINID